jgi:DNA-binding NarL/FixJ family response regulator
LTDVCRVVIADDMDDLRFLYRMSLEGRPEFEIVGEASNGQEAIDVVSEHKPDVVLLDLAMPVLDGLQALPKLREASPDTKIVILTGFDSDPLRDQALMRGAHAYLEKSVALSDISAAVWDACHAPETAS